MNINQLRPANQLAMRYGVKCVMYGGPGTGKTPLLNTAPRPVLVVVEPGMLSMRNSNIPCWEAYTMERFKEFADWLKNSSEAKNFDTVGVDSASQLAEISLTAKLLSNKDGRKAYGEMSREIMGYMNDWFYMPQKHIYLIAKQMTVDEGGTSVRKPYFPGQDLNVKVPHMYDEVLHLGPERHPNFQNPITAIRCKGTFDCVARDRSGRLDEIEEPHLERLFAKCMS